MLDNNEGHNNYEVTEQKVLTDSDSNQHTSNTKKSSGEKQLCCLGHPVSVERMIAGLLVMIAWIVMFFTFEDGLDEYSLEYFIVHGSGIPVLIIAFTIWLGGKNE
ncbi:MAG: hypothetical protein RR710_04365 [Oscillospiraceae bacterium]